MIIQKSLGFLMISLCVMSFHSGVFADDICLDAGHGVYEGTCQTCPLDTEVKTENISIPCSADLAGTFCNDQCFDSENTLIEGVDCIINDNHVCDECLDGQTSEGGEDTCKCNASGYCFDGESCRTISNAEYIVSENDINICNTCDDGFKPNLNSDGCDQFCSNANQGYENGQCVTCSENNMIVSTSATGVQICVPCVGNTSYKNGQCVSDCGDGYKSVSNVCKSCVELGEVWDGTRCTATCPVGYTADVNSVCMCNDSGYGIENAVCQKCDLFNKVPFSGNDGNNICITCESMGNDFKYFQEGSCVACVGDNDYKYENGGGIKTCKTCPANTMFDTNTNQCKSCNANEFYNQDNRQCETCPVNHECDGVNKTECSFGKVRLTGESSCHSYNSNGYGYLYNNNGVLKIVSWNNYREDDIVENYIYDRCPSGSISKGEKGVEGKKYFACGTCGDGETSNSDNTKCLCNVSSYGLIGGECAKCPNGMADNTDANGNNLCKSCGVGTGFNTSTKKCSKCSEETASYDGFCIQWSDIPNKNANGQIGLYPKGDSSNGYSWESCTPGTCCLNGQSYKCLRGTFTDLGEGGIGTICKNDIAGSCVNECTNGKTTGSNSNAYDDGTGKAGSQNAVCIKDIVASEFCIGNVGNNSLCFTFEGNNYVNAPTRFYGIEYITE